MNFLKNRQPSFIKEKLLLNHPSATYFKITFLALDDAKITADLVVPKGKIKGLIIDFPEYKTQNKDLLSLSRYSLLGYAMLSMHIRGQSGESANNIPCSHFPFLDNFSTKKYYNFVYQDALDLVSIAKNLFPKTPLILAGVGQGAAISIVASSFYNDDISHIYIADCALCDLKNIYLNNQDTNFYLNIRNFINDYPNREQSLLQTLEEIDILNYAKKVSTKVYYCHSLFETPHPHFAQEKLINSLSNIEVKKYRLEYKKIFQHVFDDFILENLSKNKFL